ncbi:MAG: OmpA family protein [Polyangiaceae bacterium]|nr:OmpA family protein [Polyangiaceae bacterium]
MDAHRGGKDGEPGRTARARAGRSSGIAAGVALAAALSCAALDARAQQEVPSPEDLNGLGADLHLFRPPVDSKGIGSVNGSDVLGHLGWQLGLWIDYGHSFMNLSDGHDQSRLVDHSFEGQFMFSLGLFDRWMFGLTGPVTLSAGPGAKDIGPTGATYDLKPYNKQALGYLALHNKVMILPAEGPLGLAAIVQIGVNTGSAGPRSLASEPGVWFWPQIALERRFTWDDPYMLRMALNAGFRGHTGDNAKFGLGADGAPQLSDGVFEYGQLVTAGYGMSFRAHKAVELFAETYMTAMVTGDSATAQRVSAEAIGGLKIYVEERSFLVFAAGAGYTPGFQSAGQRGVIGFVFEPSIQDKDHDGVPDRIDKCPDEPGPKDNEGCPDPDTDGDGVPDRLDQCPEKPGPEETAGCPVVKLKDTDGDGLIDQLDKCPDKPGPKANDGCPVDNPDRDGDGILNDADRCPDKPEIFNGVDDEDGCPDEGDIELKGNEIIILEKIQFATGSARILPQSLKVVDAVAAVMKKRKQIELLEVGGHADERGDDRGNLLLTQMRVDAVVAALQSRGIARTRLVPQGYGEYCPLDPASTESAWEKNRRVEFKVVRTDKGLTNEKLGCEAAEQKGIKPKAGQP